MFSFSFIRECILYAIADAHCVVFFVNEQHICRLFFFSSVFAACICSRLIYERFREIGICERERTATRTLSWISNRRWIETVREVETIVNVLYKKIQRSHADDYKTQIYDK